MRSNRNNQSAANQAGFALVVTLSLMILLTVIAVGLLSLSAVSLRTASQGQAAAEARANARLALMLAIGQLQAELGPDQRINAPADLAGSGLSGGRQRWVGTWESWPANVTKRPEPQFRRWLVSGPPENLGNPAFPAEASNLVSLMRGKASDLMAAPKVAVRNGGFAYAVADENSKARLGPSLPSADSEDLADHLTRYQTPPAGHNLLAGLQAVPRDEALLDRLVSGKTTDLLPGSQTALAEDTTSSTVWSEGLLTDVRNGGFRKDLSLYFQDPNSGSMTNALYKNGASLGINFQELRNFHEVSSRLTYNASSFTQPDGGKLNPDVPCLVGKSTQLDVITDPFFSYLRPMVIRVGWNFSAYSVLDTGTGKYKICIVVDPLVWLWNPFDVNLVINPGGHFGIRCWGIPYSFTIGVNSTAPITKTFKQMDPGLGGTFVGLNAGTTIPLVMRPGEVLIYGRGRVDTDPIDYKTTFNRLNTEAKLGWSGKGGYWIDTGVRAAVSDQVSISMDPNKEGQSSSGKNMMSFGLTVGKLPTSGASPYSYGVLSMGTSDGSLNYTNFPSAMFKSVPAKTFNASNLTTQQPLGLFSYLARTENEGSLKSRYLARLNPAAMNYGHQAADANTLQSLPFEPIMQPISGGLDTGIESDNGKGFFGASYKALSGQSYLVTHSVPREPPVSLGGFQHALANGLGLSIVNGRIGVTGPLQPSITHAIGNSFAPPCIAPDQTTGTFNNNVPAVDHSWLANDALWDQWFVSSLATRNAPYLSADQTGTARSQFEKFAGTNGQPVPLRNRHHLYAGKDPQTDVTDLFNNAVPKADAHLKVASLMRIHGAFNINSTDPAAWLAMFRSTHGLKVPVEPGDSTTRRWESAKNPLAGLLVPKGSAVESDDLTDPSTQDQWTGYRDPSDDELRELADAMVVEVRKRGPFLSLADFVNRRLVADDPDLASRGALQAALDRSINKKLESGTRSSSGGTSGVAFPEADAGSQMTHVPGHVKQGDILTTLGTKFTPRSDTFTIRTYGESRSPTGTLLASARCEAVIQRNADYIDPADPRHTPTANLTSEANKKFGRKFTIVAFRWLSQLES